MKRICKRKVVIDALTMCFQVEKQYFIEEISQLDFGESYDFGEFTVIRVEGRYYQNIYNIECCNGQETILWGQLKFNLNSGNRDSNIHSNGTTKVWISIHNKTLYTNDIHYLDYIATSLGLIPNNITTLDLALDTPFNVSRKLRNHIKNKNLTTILNGKVVKDRAEDRHEIMYTTSGNLDKDKYQTVNVKQRNAIHDKSRGVTVTTYDKFAEINYSGKEYILKFYGNPSKLFRTEVHLNNEDIKDYLSSKGKEFSYWTVYDEELREQMFFYHLNSVIRFQKGGENITWQHLLGRVS